jgi:hyaluronate lyase
MKKLLLAVLATAGLVLPLTIPSAVSPAHAADEYDDLRLRWLSLLTGGSGIDTADPDIAGKIDLLTGTAQTHWDALDTSSTRTALWADLDSPTVSDDVSSSFARIYQMALAYRTAGSSLEGDVALRDDIVGALEWMNDNRYSAALPKYGNWFDFEVSAAQYLNNATVLMYDDLTSGQIGDYMAAIDNYSPDPMLANGSVSAAANRVYKAHVVALRGVIGKSTTKISAGVNALTGSPNVLAYVGGGSGFYADGSYVDHGVGYTGGYGAAMLANLTNLLYLVGGSTWEVTHPSAQNVFDEVFDAFQPVVYDGEMMDLVRGREVSRHVRGSFVTGFNVIVSIARLAEAASPADALAYRRMIKEWVTEESSATYDIYDVLPIDGIVRVKAIMADSTIAPRGDLVGHRTFARMDRSVHLRPDWAYGVSMYSTRIDNYESINNENKRGWYQSYGMTYLYTPDADQFSDGYWPTVNPYRLPGTTVDVRSRTSSSEQGTKGTTTMVGGADLGTGEGVAAQDLKDNGSTLSARKSWFMFDEEVVALGAGITSTDGRTIETTIDNRKLTASGANALTVDGVAQPVTLGWSATMAGVDTVHLQGNVVGSDIGYYFPGGADLKAVRQSRSGSWSNINTNPSYLDSTSITRNFATMWVDHGANPAGGAYAYTVLPGVSTTQLSTYAAAPDTEVLQNTATAQAVRDNDLDAVGAVFWTDAPASVPLGGGATLSSTKRATVMTRQSGDILEIAVSDPTQLNTGTIVVERSGASASVVSADAGVTVTQLSPTTKVSIAVNNAKGKTFRVKLDLTP